VTTFPAALRPRSVITTVLLSSAVACNAIWGIDQGTLGVDAFEAGPDRGGTTGGGRGGTDAGRGGAGALTDARPEAATADANDGADPDAIGAADSPAEAADSMGGAGGSAGSTAGTAGTGGTPCTVCEEGQTENETVACGRCGTGSKTRSRTCTNCAWGDWSDFSTCSQCDEKPYRCCAAGSWEWCYDDGCGWTGGCAPCTGCGC
jgi:hypothetical protein